MKAITRLAAIALGVAGVAGSVALAQTTLDPKQPDNPPTANYSLFGNSNLKRDGSLSGPEKQPVTTESATDTSRTWTSTTTTTSTTATAAPAEPAPVAAAPVDTSTDTATVADASPPPRADRN
jgi:cell division protein FtsN